ncbi:fumarylacetoacetate hydrolase family protein [Arcanobacterium pinnipediorum]|uniref:Fumarylacetoacetate hydrolase family protein n=1 Tax=Arcanobacterium pinnipediorum TaxID=1503041 RepID=A0ABY5AFY8_9ACTO|nr:fumarylacetoacetate hydrolase family protein [Arcanobacterium pinnipediorum]USR78853.1 fumarylacetoacetate hydrolase family protein [Arcanobacterium pinnipediorum]
MKIARLSMSQGPRFAVVDEETGNYHIIAGDPMYSGIEPTGEIVAAAEANLVSPIIPRSKVVGLGGTYYQDGQPKPDLTKAPITFLKPNTAVVGPNVPIAEPSFATDLHHEAELAIIISRLCKDVPEERVGDVIFGYTVANDVTDVSTAKTDPQWARAKGFDTSCPLGPVIVTDLDTSDLTIRLTIDGEVVQEGSTSAMAYTIPQIVSYVSSCFTLLPGDIILTGAVAPGIPGGPGSEVEAYVEGIGTLRNPVVAD